MALVNYEKYVEMLSRVIVGTATPTQQKQVEEFEGAQPQQCPYCQADMRSFIPPHRIVHDVENCPRRSNKNN